VKRLKVDRMQVRLPAHLVGGNPGALARSVAREALALLHGEMAGWPAGVQRVEEVQVPPMRLPRGRTAEGSHAEIAAHLARSVASATRSPE
jgi:hypothetical protein